MPEAGAAFQNAQSFFQRGRSHMKILVAGLCAVFSYLISGLNPAIILSKAVYHQDIRTVGSKNPGFTNFRRTYGKKLAWFVFFLDLLKAAVLCLIGGAVFARLMGSRAFGVAFAGLFAVLGHAYPVYYGFRGGKGFSVSLSVLFFLDWRAGLIAAAVLVILLLSVKIMSVASLSSLIVGTVAAGLLKTDLPAVFLYAVCVLFVLFRHRENLHRLIHGQERKFTFRKQSVPPESVPEEPAAPAECGSGESA